MIYKIFKDIKLSRLGMGNMRLPVKNIEGNPIDYKKAEEIIDYAMNSGINYYDTAYVYHNGTSESFLGYALSKYPRDSYYIADKFYILADSDYKKVFENQLEKLKTDHIDFYLIHCLTDSTINDLINSGCIKYFAEQKKLGKIKYFGFSTHASLEVTKKFLEQYDWDFVQIQLNYYDWIFGHAKEEYELLYSKNIPIMVMESVRGGRLSSLTNECNNRLLDKKPNKSISSWAFMWLQSLPGVQIALSGMTTIEQIIDNVSTFEQDNSLTKEEEKFLFDVIKEFKKQVVVACTECKYCVEGCPKKINIPEVLKIYNSVKVDGKGNAKKLNELKSAKPWDCISCNRCLNHCPQNIDTPKYMKELSIIYNEITK